MGFLETSEFLENFFKVTRTKDGLYQLIFCGIDSFAIRSSFSAINTLDVNYIQFANSKICPRKIIKVLSLAKKIHTEKAKFLSAKINPVEINLKSKSP